jgi:hypothetical protein
VVTQRFEAQREPLLDLDGRRCSTSRSAASRAASSAARNRARSWNHATSGGAKPASLRILNGMRSGSGVSCQPGNSGSGLPHVAAARNSPAASASCKRRPISSSNVGIASAPVAMLAGHVAGGRCSVPAPRCDSHGSPALVNAGTNCGQRPCRPCASN